MPQIALPLESAPALTETTLPAQRLDPVGFRIGWDHARHGMTPPVDALHPGHPVRQGWEAGRASGTRRPAADTRAVRRWLALRLQAWACGREVDEQSVTLREVSMLDAQRCPVTGVVFSRARHDLPPTADDAVLLPLDRAGPICRGTLVLVSRRAAQAAHGVDAAGAYGLAQTLEARAPDAQAHGLDAGQWHRLSSLMSIREPQAHAPLATRPLTLLPPPRLTLVNPAHALQAALSWRLTQDDAPPPASETAAPRVNGLRRLGGLDALAIELPDAATRRCYFQFLGTLLARRLSAGSSDPDAHLAQAALEGVWTHPLLRARWEALLSGLGAERCTRLAQTVMRTTTGTQMPWTFQATPCAPCEPSDAPDGSDRLALSSHLPRGAARSAPSRPTSRSRGAAIAVKRLPSARRSWGLAGSAPLSGASGWSPA